MNSRKLIVTLTVLVLIACAVKMNSAAAAPPITTFTVTRVIDSRQRIVGTIGETDELGSAALVGLNGSVFNRNLFLLPVISTGFKNAEIFYYWTSDDCTGTPLVAPAALGLSPSMYAGPATGDASVGENILYYVRGPYTVTTLNSGGFGASPADAAVDCAADETGLLPFTGNAAPVSSFNLSTLFSPPFNFQ